MDWTGLSPPAGASVTLCPSAEAAKGRGGALGPGESDPGLLSPDLGQQLEHLLTPAALGRTEPTPRPRSPAAPLRGLRWSR